MPSAVSTKVGVNVSESELHYLANIKYPPLLQPLTLDRAIHLLAQARDAERGMNFLWFRLNTPKSGESFLYIRQRDPNGVPVDGYQWESNSTISTKTLDKTVELVKYITKRNVPIPMARLEYRLALPDNKLVFIHYLSLAVVQRFPDLLITTQALFQNRPVSATMPAQPVGSVARPLRPPLMASASGLQQGQRFVSAPRGPIKRPINSISIVKIPTEEQLSDIMNGKFDAGNDPVQRALRRIRVRQAEVRHFCIGAIHDPTSPGDSVISDLERKIEHERLQLEGAQRSAQAQRDLIDSAKQESMRVWTKIQNNSEMSHSEFEESVQPWVTTTGYKKILIVPSVRKIE